MKLVGLLFLGLVSLFLYKQAHASTGVNHYAYCAGYTTQMSYTSKKKIYTKMQKYYNDQIQSSELEKNQIVYEYYQSGVDSAKETPPSSRSIKCEEEYKAMK